MKKIVSILSALCILLAIVLVPASAAEPYRTNAAAAPDHLTLSWTSDPATSMTLTWRTDTTVTKSVVEYQAGKSLTAGTKVTGTDGELYTAEPGNDLTTQNIHRATVTGLTPGTTYAYRVGDGTNWSNTYTFTTSAKDTTTFKFLVFGDAQPSYPSTDANGPYGPWLKTLATAYAKFPDAKFMVNMGDTSENGGSSQMWDAFFDASKAVLPLLPEMCVQGNHDTFSAVYAPTAPNGFRSNFTTPANGPKTAGGLEKSCYSYDYGTVHFIVLDSQVLEEANAAAGGADILAPQLDWLDKDLSAHASATFTIVMMHKPIYYNVSTRADEELKPFITLFDKYHVDLVLAGHDHICKVTYPMKADSPVASTKDGTVYITTGRSGEKYYTNAHRNVYDSFFFDPQDQPTYNVVSVSGSRLTFDMYKQDGTLINSCAIDKAGTAVTIPAASKYVRLAVCGNLLTYPEVSNPPYKTADGVWYVPVRAVVQNVNGTVTWNASDSSITLATSITSSIKVGSTDAAVNGKPVTLKYAPTLVKGQVFIAADDLKTLCVLLSATNFMPSAMNYRYDATLNMILIDN